MYILAHNVSPIPKTKITEKLFQKKSEMCCFDFLIHITLNTNRKKDYVGQRQGYLCFLLLFVLFISYT